MAYTPPPEILEKYAVVLVNFALNSGEGLKSGEVVRLLANESAKPLYVAVRNQILKSGGHPLTFYSPDNVSRQYFELASADELSFFPAKFMKGLVDQIDHSIAILSETDKHELEGIDSVKIMAKAKAYKTSKDWLDKKENQGKFTWTLALYGTPAMAAEAGLSEEDYWGQIIKACFLNLPDPIARWREVFAQNDDIRTKLNSLQISRLHVTGNGIDLGVTLGPGRKWLGGSGRNIPSFEIFTSPDWRGTTGHIEFNQPLYRYGNLITGIKLDFKNGLVVNSSADKSYDVLQKMLEVKNADKIGEFSLTDKRLSPIDHFMAETLCDENISAPFGNMHLALGSAYDDCYTGDLKKFTPALRTQFGFNNSVIHTDIITTADRTVTAFLPDSSSRIIYQNGEFTI